MAMDLLKFKLYQICVHFEAINFCFLIKQVSLLETHYACKKMYMGKDDKLIVFEQILK